MGRYRKRPVIIDAFQMTESRRWDDQDWPAWLKLAWRKGEEEPGAMFPTKDGLALRTLEGPLSITWNDWIIRGVHGELCLCKPDIFAMTYEEVEACTESD